MRLAHCPELPYVMELLFKYSFLSALRNLWCCVTREWLYNLFVCCHFIFVSYDFICFWINYSVRSSNIMSIIGGRWEDMPVNHNVSVELSYKSWQEPFHSLIIVFQTYHWVVLGSFHYCTSSNFRDFRKCSISISVL